MSNAIKDILSAEREAEQILVKAQQERDLEILSAKQEALRIVEQGKKQIDEEFHAKLEQFRRNLDREREKITKTAATVAATFTTRAQQKLPQVQSLLLKKLEEYVHAAY
ncbi:MAG TPA: hypothetical protein VJK52_05725 [Candidatus Nanoarchaeia archaeon]|nr:hypothetical protein [Candidatus Nanoarchaeia archaeon]